MKTNTKKIKNFFSRALEILTVAGQVIVAGLAIVAITIFTIIAVPVEFVLLFIPYNPVIYWIWAIVAPKSAADALYKDKKKSSNNDFLKVFDKAWSAPKHFYMWLNRGFRWALPWRSKRCFLEVEELEGATFEEQVRFFNTSDKAKVIANNWLSDEVKKHIFDYEAQGIVALLVSKMSTLSNEQFATLLVRENWSAVITYVNKYRTINEAKLLAWVKHLTQTAEKGLSTVQCESLLRQYINKNGLPASIVNYVYSSANEQVIKSITAYLDGYAQRQMISSTSRDYSTWKKYCDQLKANAWSIYEDIQSLMNEMQYQEFKAHGWKLSEKAIISYFSREDLSMATEVIKHEDATAFDTPNIKSLVAANLSLAKLMLQLKK